ncbi:putative ubiquitinyl hydrolase 1 [Helianthus annuus]|nr:putative ubiquitinyl hydrolase 1 [Helianthus annuus]
MAIEESCSGDLRTTSVSPPAHYILHIQQFSLLIKQHVERYESNEFEAAGYKWKLVIHPNGNKSKDAGKFLSLYLAMADATSLPPGWEVYATFRIFLLDQNNDNYMTLEDEMREGRRFHRLRTEWGFDKFISLKEFGDSENGYLVGDKCVFGAEVFVSKETSKGKTECLSMLKDALSYKHSWMFTFSKVNANCETSNIFNVGGHKWKILLYPNGVKGVGGGYISLKLALADVENLPSGTKIFVEFTLRIWDQLNARHDEGKASHWFSASDSERGWQRFVSHAIFFQTNRGLLHKDICYIQADVAIHGEKNVFG